MAPGRLIVIEGNDGSGKRTQSELLVSKLRTLGFSVEVADFPQYYSSFHGKMIGKYLRGEFGKIEEIDPHFASLLYAGDRLEAKPMLDRWISEGKIIIANRYATSNMAFMGARIKGEDEKKEFLSWLDELEYSVNKIPRPDLVLYLDVPLDISQKWIKSKEKREYLQGKTKDIHEKNLPYLKKVEELYLHIAKSDPCWKIVPCTEDEKILSIDEISNRINQAIAGLLE